MEYKDVEVIALFDYDGKITPIKLKCFEEDEIKVIVIKKVNKRYLEKKDGFHIWNFQCSSIINRKIISYALKYNVEMSKWSIFNL